MMPTEFAAFFLDWPYSMPVIHDWLSEREYGERQEQENNVHKNSMHKNTTLMLDDFFHHNPTFFLPAANVLYHMFRALSCNPNNTTESTIEEFARRWQGRYRWSCMQHNCKNCMETFIDERTFLLSINEVGQNERKDNDDAPWQLYKIYLHVPEWVAVELWGKT